MNIEVQGTRGVYEVTGDGPPLVLLASPVARAAPYRTTAASLGRSFRVYTVELPGCGRGGSVGAGWSVGRYAEWVHGCITALNVIRPVVIGHSHAGAITVVLAARRPAAVGRLVVVDSTGTGPHSAVRVFTAGLLDLALEFEIVPVRWHHVLGNLVLHPRNFVRQVRDAITSDVRTEAARVTVPTLVAWGARSCCFPRQHAAEYARCLPGAHVYLSPRGAHDWLIDRPEEFAAVIERFAHPSSTPNEAPVGT